METAGHAVSDAAMGHFALGPRDRVLVVCGTGNNGGDGAVAARFLLNAGIAVTVAMLRPPPGMTRDARANAEILSRMGARILPADPNTFRYFIPASSRPTLIIDALFGTGLDRPLRPALAVVVEWINAQRDQHGSKVLAVDVPSGLDADTGRPWGDAVRADLTVTFVGPKVGFRARGAKAYLGQVVVADLGIPRRLADAVAEPPAGRGVDRRR